METNEYLPKQAIGNYIIQQKIGEGAFGKVYAACKNEEGVKEWFAVKVIKKSSVQLKELGMLLNSELSVGKQVQSKYLIKLIEYFQTDNNYVIVHEYCEYGNLETLLNRVEGNKLDEELSIKFIRSIVLGYNDLYINHILHRDIKPENICIKQNSHGEFYTLLGDFGFAKCVEGPMTDFILKEGTIMGTLLFMSPEMLSGAGYNYQCDIFSIGVTFYKMLFGRYPFVYTTPLDLNNAYAKGKIIFNLSSLKISKYSLDFILRCLQFKPEQRIRMAGMIDHPLLKKSLFDLRSPLNLFENVIIEKSILTQSDILEMI
jgi:serine/threonine protein kinase